MVEISYKQIGGQPVVDNNEFISGNNANLRSEEQTVPDLTVKVKAGVAIIFGTTIIKSSDFNSSAFTPPGSNDRIDLLVIDVDGTVSIVEGVSAVSPTIPVTPANKKALVAVYLRTGSTEIWNDDSASGADGTESYIYQDLRTINLLDVSRMPRVTSGEALAIGDAVYLKKSDNKVYGTDADDADTTFPFIGFVLETASGADEEIAILPPNNELGGLSGLTPADWYFLAKAGTGEGDTSVGVDSTNNQNIGDNAQTRRGWTIVTTEVGFLNKMVIKLRAVGSPDGNTVVRLRASTPTDIKSAVGASGAILGTVTLANSTLTGSYVSYDFDFNIRVPIGSVWVEIYKSGTQDNANCVQVNAGSGNDVDCWVYSTGTNTWVGNSNDHYASFDFEPTVFGAGDITTWFYDEKKPVGRALSATNLLCETTNLDSRSGLLEIVASDDDVELIVPHGLNKPPKAIRLQYVIDPQSASGAERTSGFGIANQVTAEGGKSIAYSGSPNHVSSIEEGIVHSEATTVYGLLVQLGGLDETDFNLYVTVNALVSADKAYILWEVIG